MSHITGVDNTVILNDLEALKLAVAEFCPTMEFVPNTKHYRTWKDDHNGKLVGDWPLPEGWTAAMVGENAEHILRIKAEHLPNGPQSRTARDSPYEIGIVPVVVTRDAKGNVLKAVPSPKGTEYILMADWWANGNGTLLHKGIGARKTVTDPVTKKSTEMAFGELYMRYRMMETKMEAERQGDTIEFQEQADGTVIALCDTTARLGC